MHSLESSTKTESIQICEKLGLTLPSYLRMCMSRLIQEQGIPFSMTLREKENRGIRALSKASQIAKEQGISEMTLDEINAEIAEARK